MSYQGQQWQEQEQGFDSEALIRRAIEFVDTGKSMPLSNNVILPRDELRDLLIACLENLPLEVRQANWLLRERAEFLAKMQREGDQILGEATERSQRLVEKSELVREARRVAQNTVDQADDESRRLRVEAEDYVDSKLAEFEETLENTYRIVQAGRQKLRAAPPLMDGNEIDTVEQVISGAGQQVDVRGHASVFYDQEFSDFDSNSDSRR